MPWNKVPSKFESGDLHSGSKTGPKVKSRKQMVAILLSEKKKAEGGDTEYQPIKGLKAAKPSSKD